MHVAGENTCLYHLWVARFKTKELFLAPLIVEVKLTGTLALIMAGKL